MGKEKKIESINNLEKLLKKSNIAILADYRGLTATNMTGLRRKMHEQNVEFKVVKNTLTRFAAEKAGVKGLDKYLQGPIAIAFGYNEDVAQPAKAFTDYIKSTKSTLKIKAGVLSNRVINAEEISRLVSLPPKPVLIAQLAGNLKAPLAALVYVLNDSVSGLARVLQARVKQLETAK